MVAMFRSTLGCLTLAGLILGYVGAPTPVYDTGTVVLGRDIGLRKIGDGVTDEIDAMTCFFAAPWGAQERLTWDSYITPHPDIRVCIEARLGDHYGWHPGWSRVGCVPSTVTSLRPQDLMTIVGPIAPIIMFRAVAVREFLDQDCIDGGSPEHYCLAEKLSSPGNVICGGRFLVWPDP